MKDDAHESAQLKPQKPESPSPQAQTAAKTESAQAQSVREEVSASKVESERAAQALTGKPGAKTEAHTGSQETPAQAAKPAESPIQAAASEKKPEDKPAETTATNAQTAVQPGTSSTVSYGIDTAERARKMGNVRYRVLRRKSRPRKVRGTLARPIPRNRQNPQRLGPLKVPPPQVLQQKLRSPRKSRRLRWKSHRQPLRNRKNRC